MKTVKIISLSLVLALLAGVGLYFYHVSTLKMELNPKALKVPVTVWRTGAVEFKAPEDWRLLIHRTEFVSVDRGPVRGLALDELPYPDGLPKESVFNDRTLTEPFPGFETPRYRLVELPGPEDFQPPLRAVARLDSLSSRTEYLAFILKDDHYLQFRFVHLPENREPEPDPNLAFHSDLLAQVLQELDRVYFGDRENCTNGDMLTAFGCARPDPRYQLHQRLTLFEPGQNGDEAVLSVWSNELGPSEMVNSRRRQGFDPYLNDYRTLSSRLLLPLITGIHPQTLEHSQDRINGLKAVRKTVLFYKALPWGPDDGDMKTGWSALMTDLYIQSGRSVEDIYDTWLSAGDQGPAPENRDRFNQTWGRTQKIWASVRPISTLSLREP